MNSSIKAVIFDWAWTLADLVDEDDRRPFRKIFGFLQEKGVEMPDFNDCYQTYRELFYKMIAESRQTHREACFESVLTFLLLKYRIAIAGKATVEEILVHYYEEVYSVRKLFPDVLSTLQGLQSAGMRMGIISNTTNPPFMKDRERKQMGVDSFFEFSIYSSDVPYRKPHPSIFGLAVSYLQLEPQEILFVGDSPANDIAGARNSGMQTAWINRNGGVFPDSIRPDFQVRALTDLLEVCIAPEISKN
ncbi:MAG: HAD family hydrolase [Nitrospinaceae bacterium]|nr:MAG: HAD family hydrolase [Nitrospinaceae bacterium]